jgi:hypothetical protein
MHKSIQKHRIHRMENKNKKNTNLTRISKNISRVIRKLQKAANNNEITYYTKPTYNYITINQSFLCLF